MIKNFFCLLPYIYIKALAFSLLISIFISYPLYSQWQIDGIPVSDTTGKQAIGSIVSDDKGGAFIIWGDSRSDWNIYAQHLDSSGYFYWEKQGRPICQTSGLQFAPQAVSDGEGGFVAIWHDTRNDGSRDIYAQRVNFNGDALWQTNGIPLVIQPYDQSPKGFIRTRESNFIIGWLDDRWHLNPGKTYAQKFSLDGQMLWDANGVIVSNYLGSPEIVSDMNDGGIFIWASWDGSNQMYVQRLDSAGNRLWGDDGIVASTNFAHWSDTRISVCSDSAGGAIFAWDYSQIWDAYIQRLDSLGNRLWGDSGITIGTIGKQQWHPKVSMLNKNRVICVWKDSIYLNLQKFDLQVNHIFHGPV